MSKNHDKINNPEEVRNDDIEINDVEANPEEVDAEAAKEMAQEELTKEEALEKELADTKAQLEKEKKEYLFLMAEFDNFRKRTLREKSDIIRNAGENVLKGLLPIVDDFERGLEATAKATDPESIRTGMELIYNKLIKYLAQNGVTPIESTGKPFDADLHEAIANVPVPDESQRGVVIDTLTKGYMLNDKVLRHAKVAVGQ